MPRDPNDDKDVILEVKAGEGGEESALFAGDLLRMYLRYAERVGWKTEILDANESDLGGYKDVQVAVKAKASHEPGQGVWARLKYEGGVHRVQRVPATESQGRIHTSAAGVLVTPEAEDVLARDGFDPAFGARPLKRLIQREIGDRIGPTVAEVAVPLDPSDYPSDSTCNAFDAEQVIKAW